MSLAHLVLVALVQGITEFLPISSQAHLILVPRLTGLCDQGLTIDIAVHVGTLGAVMIYFWRDCLAMGRGALSMARGRLTPDGRLFALVVLATLPVVGAGYLYKSVFHLELRSIEVIGWTTLGFGVVLWAADRWGLRIRRIEHTSWGAALAIGCAQVLALIPGTSRSGITMTAARLLGFERTDAARFSLLMAIPVIVAAGTLAGLDLVAAGSARLTADALMAVALSLVAALAAIAALMGWLRRASFLPFVLYRLVLGAALLVAVYGYGVSATVMNGACPG